MPCFFFFSLAGFDAPPPPRLPPDRSEPPRVGASSASARPGCSPRASSRARSGLKRRANDAALATGRPRRAIESPRHGRAGGGPTQTRLRTEEFLRQRVRSELGVHLGATLARRAPTASPRTSRRVCCRTVRSQAAVRTILAIPTRGSKRSTDTCFRSISVPGAIHRGARLPAQRFAYGLDGARVVAPVACARTSRGAAPGAAPGARRATARVDSDPIESSNAAARAPRMSRFAPRGRAGRDQAGRRDRAFGARGRYEAVSRGTLDGGFGRTRTTRTRLPMLRGMNRVESPRR